VEQTGSEQNNFSAVWALASGLQNEGLGFLQMGMPLLAAA
jgi:hypothetical protein